MAAAHITFSETSQHGRLLRQGLFRLEGGLDDLNDVLATLAQMRDGDGSQAAHFTYATAKFGTTSDAQTKSLNDELASVMAKLTTDGSVTNVNAALLQIFAKLR